MEILYDNKTVETLFNNFDLMSRKLDYVLTKQIKKKYDQLRASETFGDFLATGLGKTHPLKGDKYGCYAIHITGSVRMIISPVFKDSSGESLKICTQITLKGVEDYHGNKITSYIP